MKKIYGYIGKGIVIIAIGLVIFGLSKGDYKDVLNKAIHICYECIGIG